MALPEGWTDDMNIQIPPGKTLDELVDRILEAAIRRDVMENVVSELVSPFGLSEEDATLAFDRACAGVVRAATGNPLNCPNREKDPIAWLVYQKCLKQPNIIAAVCPQFVSRKRGS